MTEYKKYSLYLNKLLQASCLSPFGPAGLFKFVPDEFVRKNLAAPGKLLLPSPKSAYCWCPTIGTPHRRDAGRTIPVGDIDRSPFIRFTHSYGYASAGDQPILFAIFPLTFVPFMQHPG